jgi:queuine/archaeosine tRNA-ribosyltransferase
VRILIITSCTGEKKFDPENQLTLDDFRQGPKHVQARERELKDMLTPAGEIYTGEQHVRLMRGVETARAAGIDCTVAILSAGYGFISETRKVAPYECTFATMKTKELKDWAAHLHSPQGFRAAVAEPYDFGLILLGDNYLQSCALDASVKLGGPTLLFAGQGPAKKLPRIANLRVTTLSNPEAKRFSCGLVGLKGELADRLLKKITADVGLVQRLTDPATNVLAMLDADTGAAPKVSGRTSARANAKVDMVIHIPKSWWDKPHRKKLRYFIPEWDDLVDPDYDFLNDQHSGGGGDWSNEVYAHQMYPEPNYDGILMSRAVAEKSKKKKDRVNALGVHRFLRVPREFPIMGDCGAFDYIMEEKPPYTTADVLDYYTRLDFDYGVSVDHLIVSATEHQKQFRYELTINNAEEFLKEHRKAGLKWEPIGAVQGWDPDSYANAAAQYVKMGYRYIGLGGLVRTKSSEIIEIIKSVRKVVPSAVSIHLFGVARLNAVTDLASAGIQSVDSASYLRQAWMRLHQSYTTSDGPYAALRIPEAGKSFRAKHMLQHPDMTDDKITRMEHDALVAVRKYGSRECSLHECLQALLTYDQFVTAERVSMEQAYRRTLEARIWEKCDCAICKRWGIEVLIFRGNNRNRRRGFHNTYVFYRLFQKLLAGERVSFLEDDPEQLKLPEISGES